MIGDFDEVVEGVKGRKSLDDSSAREHAMKMELLAAIGSVQRAVLQGSNSTLQALVKGKLKVNVENQVEIPKSVATPDAIVGADVVAQAIKTLQSTVESQENVDITPIVSRLEALQAVLDRLPTEYPEMPEHPTEMAVKGLQDVVDAVSGLQSSIEAIEVSPTIKVEAPKIDLSKEFKQLEKTIAKLDKEIVIPEQKETDVTPVVSAVDAVRNAINSLVFPVPNVKPVFLDSAGHGAQPVLEADGSVPVTIVAGGGGGGGDASAAKQDEQTALLTQIQTNTANTTIEAGDINLNTDEIEAKLDTIASQQQQDALTDAQLRAAPVDVDTGLTQPTTPSDTQPISAASLPLPTGAATAANQLPDGHQVEVNNFPTEYPLPAAQITTLTPPAAITGFATEAKQDDIITAIGGIGAPPTYTTRIDEASSTVTYIGDAAIGSSESSSIWRIKKIDTTSGTSITFADGNGNFDNQWSGRAGLSYS